MNAHVSQGGWPVLVLNADFRPLSYYPLSLWSWQDAIKAVFLDRVNIVEYYDRAVRSPSFEIQLPSVVSLKSFVKPTTHPAFTRFNVFLRDRFSCQYCLSPDDLTFELIEPLRALFKDEVRALGRELGLPDRFIGRHPFPGPGLAIRCPGEITREKLDILRKADAVFIDQIRRHGLYDDIWQAFVAILPVRTVGVMGDGRTYDYACALRAVTSVDGMTADYYPFSHTFLGETATRIINEVKGINRVTYDITSKPPGTIEWE